MNALPQRDLALLVAANRAATFGVVARWVLHDIRSPVQSLTLLPDLLPDPDADIENTLREACDHLGQCLELLSRVVSTPPAEGVAPIPVSDPLEFIAALHRSNLTTTRLDIDIEPTVQAAAGNQQHLEHGLLCLLLRAGEGLRGRKDGLIRITARNDGETVAIEFGDNGPGLPPDAAAIFDREHPTPPDSDQSTLVVVREVLRLAGGTVAYHADHGAAGRFLIQLPAWRRASRPG